MKKDLLDKKRFTQYLLYAIGEILLIIIGIMIAVKINERVKDTEESEIRCLYLKELQYTFEYDIKDVDDNLIAFENWDPKLHAILKGIKNKRLSEVDSLYDKFGTVGNYIVFGQRSKTKIEELKYASINLIENRELKNRILLYQDDYISNIRFIEKGYQSIGQDLRQYYAIHFSDFNYTEAIPLDLKRIENDNYYYSLVLQRLRKNRTLEYHYKRLNKEQKAIKELVIREIEKNCTN